MKRKSIAALCLAVCICFVSVPPALALKSTTLRNGMRGEEVRVLQQALIDLGFLKGTADGIFGNNTENAVRKFQRQNKLTSDGLAGEKTRDLLMSKVSGSSKSTKTTSASTAKSTASSASSSSSSSKVSLFGGNYNTMNVGSYGTRVKALQNALIKLNFLAKGSADGKYGRQTQSGVKAFQKSKKLTADGIAGKKTLQALESAVGAEAAKSSSSSSSSSKTTSSSSQASSSSSSSSGSINQKISAPSKGSIKLLKWYDEVKPSLSNKQKLLIYDPSSGLSWTLSILSRGRHCDAEPLTKQDTDTMVKAFGGKNTWTQKGVYVRLPDGRWTVGSTHDMPHESGSIKDNGFNGHLCVHFYRTMEETTKNDPNYGVSNQNTIRSLWKSLTGKDIPD